jgi:hypothetical protein
LQLHGQNLVDYAWSGWVLNTVLEYLKEEQSIDLEVSDYDELSEFLTKARGVSHSVLTSAHKLAHLDKLSGQFSEERLRDYYNEFHETSEPDAGKPMLDGVRAIQQSLSQVDDESVILLIIG